MRLLFYKGTIKRFDDKELGKAEINFSREYEFKPSENFLDVFNPDISEVKISRAQDYLPRNFWSDDGNVYNCSLFVGKNGSGKTTILHNIIFAILGSEFSNNLLIWQDGDKIKAYATIVIPKNSKIEKRSYYAELAINKLPNDETQTWLCKDFREIKDNNMYSSRIQLMYFSNAFSQNDLMLMNNTQKKSASISNDDMISNVSLAYQVNERVSDRDNKENLNGVITGFWAEKFKDVLEFILANSDLDLYIKNELKERFHILIPKKIKIASSLSLYESTDSPLLIPLRNNLLEKGNVGFIRNGNALTVNPDFSKNPSIEVVPYLFAVQSILQFINANLPFNKIDGVSKQVMENRCSNDYERKKLLDTCIEELMKINRTDLRDNGTYCAFQQRLCAVKAFVDYLYEDDDFKCLCNKLEGLECKMYKKPNFPYIECYIDIEKLRSEGEKALFLKFFQFYNPTIGGILPFLQFNMGLSSGEENMLNMLASVYKCSVEKAFREQIDTLIIFMDEADIGYHPEWQREWFYIFPRIIEAIMVKNKDKQKYKDIDIQFVLASHSPLLLGDMPSRCSYYIDKNEKGLRIKNQLISREGEKLGTFGLNLYSILQSGFFLEKTAIGETAVKKSEEIAEAFVLFRELIKLIEDIKANDGKCPDTTLKDLNDLVDKINKKNDEAANLFNKDGIPYKEDVFSILIIDKRPTNIKFEAYLKYIKILINLYSGFIRNKLLNEYEDIESDILICINDKKKAKDLIDDKIRTLELLKSRLDGQKNND